VDTVQAGGGLLDWHYNPLEEVKFQNDITKTQRLNFSTSAGFQFLSWLRGTISFGYTQEIVQERNLQSVESYSARTLVNRYYNSSATIPALQHPLPVGGILDFDEDEQKQINGRGQIDVNKRWTSGKNELTALVAGEIGQSRSTSFSSRFYGYNQYQGYVTSIDYASSFPLFTGGTAPVPDDGLSYGGDGSLGRSVSLLANASYAYQGRYRIYASARKDGANLYGVATNHKWKPLWSAGAGWDISKESFYHVRWLPSLRLRASYGFSGNSNDALIAVGSIGIGGTNRYTLTPTGNITTVPNPSLRWEQVATLNLGLDFSLANRISGSVEWYQ
jgi:hypothetical protein